MKHILNLSEGFDIYADANQWIVAKARKKGVGSPTALGYIGSTKDIIIRVCREKNAPIDPIAHEVMDKWPNRFLDWKEESFDADS
jgi:hypothetical protein|tara:strand:- start:256 stop:510 length:255 start_codon:yes stop_codon:yes gene_type:complete